MTSSKYSRTFHLPYSPGGTSDDKRLKSDKYFLNVNIIITEKLDGSNVCMDSSGCFARTHAAPPTHASFDAFKSLYSSLKHLMLLHYQFFGEWCYALHSIKYDNLEHYFNLIGVRDTNKGVWLSWDEVSLWAEELGVPHVPALFKGVVPTSTELQKVINGLCAEKSVYGEQREGIVIRLADEFADADFSTSVAKMVRKNHVAPNMEHWKHREIVKNQLK